jgi:hypothetical protein
MGSPLDSRHVSIQKLNEAYKQIEIEQERIAAQFKAFQNVEGQRERKSHLGWAMPPKKNPLPKVRTSPLNAPRH